MMASILLTSRNADYLPEELSSINKDLENKFFYFEREIDTVHFKLHSTNIYRDYFVQVYPEDLDESQLNEDMLDVLRSYTDSRSNECYVKTNLNLLSACMNGIDWNYVNRLRSVIRSLSQTDLKHVYYRGLNLTDIEISHYMAKRKRSFYTTSFLSFTTDRLLIYPGNALMILNIDRSSDEAKKNIANIWKWSAFKEEKEALVAVGSRLKIMSVHYFCDRWQIELELIDEKHLDEEETIT